MSGRAASGAAAVDIVSAGVKITGLTKIFGDRRVVDTLDLEIAPGELVSLLGPSGCGKTTTLRMVAGFLQPDGGAVVIDDRDVTSMPPEKRPTAMVFQNYALWPHMSVFNNIAYPLKIRRLPKAEIARQVDAMLELVNLTHHRTSRPAQISGGEQQRVALARALVQQPKVLLLDEPLSNLDAKLRVRVREDIRSLQTELGITTLLVTHDQDEALSMSDRIAVMNGGKIEQFSAPAELYADPHTEFVANFVGSLNQIAGRWTAAGPQHDHDAAGVTTAFRPEDVLLTTAADGAGIGPIGTVTRVVPRGHFTEVVVDLAGESLHSYVTGDAPPGGARVRIEVRRQLVFRDGVRESSR